MDCEIQGVRPIFKSEMFIYQSKGNVDEKSYFGKITPHLAPETRKMLVRSLFGNQDSTSILVCNLLEIKILNSETEIKRIVNDFRTIGIDTDLSVAKSKSLEITTRKDGTKTLLQSTPELAEERANEGE